MLAVEAAGIILMFEDKSGYFLHLHFSAAVAVSGSLSPRMYIQLKKVYDDSGTGLSWNLSSFRFASLFASFVSSHYSMPNLNY
jgi:hypothetical protein